MFPTLASLVEERMKDDPELTHDVIHALNEWMYETWSFNYEDRIFATPVDNAADRRARRRRAAVVPAARRTHSVGPARSRTRVPRQPFVRFRGVRPVLAGVCGRRDSGVHARL
jgi:hypothetical protein